MSSFVMNTQDSDEEVDLEALRLAALKSRKAKFGPRINRNNLIPIVPVSLTPSEFDETKIKKEKLSPPPQENSYDPKSDAANKINEEEKLSNYSETTLENDQDILSVEDKEEEDSLERLMDQLEAEISGKAPSSQANKTVSSSGKSISEKNSKRKQNKVKTEGDDEVELIQVKAGKEPGAIIEIRESASPERASNNSGLNKSEFPALVKSPNRRSESRSRSPFYGDRHYMRSRSPYWSKSPRRSKSPYRRSRSPFWLSRRSRSSSRKSRSPYRRYPSPNRKRSLYVRYSRSRSISFDRRRSPWSSPRRRSKSPLYREWSPSFRRRSIASPLRRGRRSISPRENNLSPRRRSRSPRRFPRNSPFRRSKSPFRRSKSPARRNKSPLRRPQSPYLCRSKSPLGKLNSPGKRPVGRRSRSPGRWSASPGRKPKSPDRLSPRPRSKSPTKKTDAPRKSPRHSSKDGRSFSFSPSPNNRRNRSPLKVVEKNRLDGNESSEKPKDRMRGEKRHRSSSRENKNFNERRPYRQRNQTRRFSPSRGRRSAERYGRRSKSPRANRNSDKTREEDSSQNQQKTSKTSPVPLASLDPVLEARKKKFETLSEIDPTVDKKISLKSIKESMENAEEDEDALTINLEGNLWDESEESGDEFESRFKSSEAVKNKTASSNRSVLSFRNLREGDSVNRQTLLNKPLIDESWKDKGGRRDRSDRWQGKRAGRNDNNTRRRGSSTGRKDVVDDLDWNKSKADEKKDSGPRKLDRKPIVWSKREELKPQKTNERLQVQGSIKEDKIKTDERKPRNSKETSAKTDAGAPETDDFDKLISDFEKELESDVCLISNAVDSTTKSKPLESKQSRVAVKEDLLEKEKPSTELPVKKPGGNRIVKISEASSNKPDFGIEETSKFVENIGNIGSDEAPPDGPEDYLEDDDFTLEMSTTKQNKKKVEEEDNQSDLRAVLSRRRNQRLTKVVNLQENVPTRLVQSAFQGLGSKKLKRPEREVQGSVVEQGFEKSVRTSGVERRRVLLLQRENSSLNTNLIKAPEVKPDTTIYQRMSRASDRRKRKLQRQLDPMEGLVGLDQEEEEDGGFEVEEGKQSRRFRLKRNVKLSSQFEF